MRIILMACSACLLLGSAAVAQTQKADPRAVDYCKAKGQTFVAVSDCLPDAHVSFATLDAFDKLYPVAAKPLKDKCAELNKDNITATAVCVTEAISKAVKLKDTLPAGSALNDSVFDAVADKALDDKLGLAAKQARKAFPDKSMWGMTMYQPYK